MLVGRFVLDDWSFPDTSRPGTLDRWADGKDDGHQDVEITPKRALTGLLEVVNDKGPIVGKEDAEALSDLNRPVATSSLPLRRKSGGKVRR